MSEPSPPGVRFWKILHRTLTTSGSGTQTPGCCHGINCSRVIRLPSIDDASPDQVTEDVEPLAAAAADPHDDPAYATMQTRWGLPSMPAVRGPPEAALRLAVLHPPVPPPTGNPGRSAPGHQPQRHLRRILCDEETQQQLLVSGVEGLNFSSSVSGDKGLCCCCSSRCNSCTNLHHWWNMYQHLKHCLCHISQVCRQVLFHHRQHLI